MKIARREESAGWPNASAECRYGHVNDRSGARAAEPLRTHAPLVGFAVRHRRRSAHQGTSTWLSGPMPPNQRHRAGLASQLTWRIPCVLAGVDRRGAVAWKRPRTAIPGRTSTFSSGRTSSRRCSTAFCERIRNGEGIDGRLLQQVVHLPLHRGSTSLDLHALHEDRPGCVEHEFVLNRGYELYRDRRDFAVRPGDKGS